MADALFIEKGSPMKTPATSKSEGGQQNWGGTKVYTTSKEGDAPDSLPAPAPPGPEKV